MDNWASWKWHMLAVNSQFNKSFIETICCRPNCQLDGLKIGPPNSSDLASHVQACRKGVYIISYYAMKKHVNWNVSVVTIVKIVDWLGLVCFCFTHTLSTWPDAWCLDGYLTHNHPLLTHLACLSHFIEVESSVNQGPRPNSLPPIPTKRLLWPLMV